MVDGLFLNMQNTSRMSYTPPVPPMGQFGFQTNPMMTFGFPTSAPKFDGDFMTTMLFYQMMMQNQLSFGSQSDIFNQNFNTKTDLAQLQRTYNPQLGNNLANIAYRNATNQNSRGRCFNGVRKSLEKADLSNGEIRGQSAYQAANMLSNHRNFKEVSISREDLKNLPAGCVIVWNKTAGHPHGHIAVTLGNGSEASDHVQKNLAMLKSAHRVFVPVGMNKSA